MSQSLQGRLTTSNANTWVANSYYIVGQGKHLCFKQVLKCRWRWCSLDRDRIIHHFPGFVHTDLSVSKTLETV